MAKRTTKADLEAEVHALRTARPAVEAVLLAFAALLERPEAANIKRMHIFQQPPTGASIPASLTITLEMHAGEVV